MNRHEFRQSNPAVTGCMKAKSTEIHRRVKTNAHTANPGSKSCKELQRDYDDSFQNKSPSAPYSSTVNKQAKNNLA